MAYATAFSLGDCTVTVRNRLGNSIFSQTMGTNEYEPFTDPDTGVELTIYVNSDASVELQSLTDMEPGGSYGIYVTPLYTIQPAAPMQLSTLEVSPETFVARVFADPATDAAFKLLDSVAPPAPDPVLISDLAGPHTVLGMEVARSEGV